MTAYLVVFVAAAVVTFLATPLVRWFVIKVGRDLPAERPHGPPAADCPTMGGIAMYLGLVGLPSRVAVPRRSSAD